MSVYEITTHLHLLGIPPPTLPPSPRTSPLSLCQLASGRNIFKLLCMQINEKIRSATTAEGLKERYQ